MAGQSRFVVWPDGDDAGARPCEELSAERAAERRAREDWLAGEETWPHDYRVRDEETGTTWVVGVTVALEPTFVTITAHEVSMPAATHVLWGGAAVCRDPRLRGLPGRWPDGQRWISLRDVASGVELPIDGCDKCRLAAPSLVAEIRQIGAPR